MLVKHFGNIQKLQSHFSVAEDVGAVRGIWIVGDPGCGKSYFARRYFPSIYVKSQNKWWDGYKQ